MVVGGVVDDGFKERRKVGPNQSPISDDFFMGAMRGEELLWWLQTIEKHNRVFVRRCSGCRG